MKARMTRKAQVEKNERRGTTKKTEYYKHPTFGHVYGTKLVTPVGRLSWPYLSSPKEGMEQADGTKSAPRYEITLLLQKDNPKVEAFNEKVMEMAEGMVTLFNQGKKGAKLSVDDLEPWKDEDQFDEDKYPYYKGMGILVARNSDLPNLISIDKTEKGDYVPFEAQKFLAGMLVRCVVTPILTTHGLSYKLNDVQFVRDDGKRFGGSAQDSSGLLAEAEDELLDELTDEDADISLEEAASRL